MKAITATGLTKLIQLIKDNFISNSDVEELEIDTTPTANSNNLITSGGVKTYIDNQTYTLPTATTSTLGGVKVDGTSITINNGIISTEHRIYISTAEPTASDGSVGDIWIVYEEN